jgi:phosphate transport system protein
VVVTSSFQNDLEAIDQKVGQLFSLVASGIAVATDAFLTGDRLALNVMHDQEELMDQTYTEVEDIVQRCLVLHSPVAADLRYLLSCVRIVPELERCGDLAEHIARKGGRGLAQTLTPRTRGTVEQMGELASTMWRLAAEGYSNRDAATAARLRTLDERLDELHVALIAEVVESGPPTPIAMEMALVARFYERLGDHAVNIANRMRYAISGISVREPDPE